MFLSRFCLNAQGRKEGQEFRSLEVRGKLIALKNSWIHIRKIRENMLWAWPFSWSRSLSGLAKHFPHSLHIWFFLPSWTSTICLLNLLLLKNVLPHNWQLGFSLLWIMTCFSNSSLFSKFSWSQFGQLKVKKKDD